MRRIWFLILTAYLCSAFPLLAKEVDGIKTKSNAVKIAEKGLQYLERGNYEKALMVGLEGKPEYQKVRQQFRKKDFLPQFKASIGPVQKEAGPILSRSFYSVRRSLFPLGSPTYYVTFLAKTKKGLLRENVSLRYRRSDGPKRSKYEAAYILKFKKN